MGKFKVGDHVEVIMGGSGIADKNIGRKTVITAIGGDYAGDPGIKTRDFLNPQYDGWISERSVKLVSLKVGDRVICVPPTAIPDGNKGDRHYPKGKGWELGKIFKIGEITGSDELPIYWPADGENGVYENALAHADHTTTPQTTLQNIIHMEIMRLKGE